MVIDYTPISGSNSYFVSTVYGLLSGNKQQASKHVEREARRICAGEFQKISEEEHKRLTRWGAENGQIDLIWKVRCS